MIRVSCVLCTDSTRQETTYSFLVDILHKYGIISQRISLVHAIQQIGFSCSTIFQMIVSVVLLSSLFSIYFKQWCIIFKGKDIYAKRGSYLFLSVLSAHRQTNKSSQRWCTLKVYFLVKIKKH